MTERFWELVTKSLTSTATPVEKRELEELCSQHAEFQETFTALSHYWSLPNATQPPPDEALLQRHLEKLSNRFPEFVIQSQLPPHKVSGWLSRAAIRWAAAAAVVSILVFAGWRAFYPGGTPAEVSHTPSAMTNEVSTPPGNRSMLVLPDGTKVWVNANSQLTFDVGFGKDNRNVTLNGEAYFIAAKNKQLPLIITTSQMVVKVTGTTFNVRAYPNETKFETSLFEGSVTVVPLGDSTNMYILKPNQKLILDRLISKELQQKVAAENVDKNVPSDVLATNFTYPQITLKQLEIDPKDNMPYEGAWVYNTLAFSNESFGDIAKKMENWFGVEISFANENLSDIHFTGKFTTESITEALEALQFTAKFSFRKEEKKVFIY